MIEDKLSVYVIESLDRMSLENTLQIQKNSQYKALDYYRQHNRVDQAEQRYHDLVKQYNQERAGADEEVR